MSDPRRVGFSKDALLRHAQGDAFMKQRLETVLHCYDGAIRCLDIVGTPLAPELRAYYSRLAIHFLELTDTELSLGAVAQPARLEATRAASG
jgi:hypothetical protein